MTLSTIYQNIVLTSLGETSFNVVPSCQGACSLCCALHGLPLRPCVQISTGQTLIESLADSIFVMEKISTTAAINMCP